MKTLYCYPSYNTINLYLDLFYSVASARINVVYIKSLYDLDKNGDLTDSIVHIHWTNDFFKDVDRNHYGDRSREILTYLLMLKQAGAFLIWTIHNEVSHDTKSDKSEVEFNIRLCEIVDIITIHHPAVCQILPWIKQHNYKLYVLEHGKYPYLNYSINSKAKNILGIPISSTVFSLVGTIREYKNYNSFIPRILEFIQDDPRAFLLISGMDKECSIDNLLPSSIKSRIYFSNKLLDSSEYDILLDATDFGLLSYKKILTSGSMFHYLSRGVPVIAPRLGTIPCYIISAWNGFVYDDNTNLYKVLQAACSLSASQKLDLKYNSLKSVKCIKWSFNNLLDHIQSRNINNTVC